MDLIDNLKNLAQKILKIKDSVLTEEATKNALVMPFISMLGYDVFDPTEVVPEYTADIGTKKGEKVDYAVFKDGNPAMFFECKKCGANLDIVHASQLYRYFATNTKIKLAVLTNGIHYQFYSDLEETNVMDKKPFLEIDMLDIQENAVNELKKMSKSQFDIEKIVSSASELMYMNETKKVLSREWNNPSDDFVKFFIGQVYSGVKTQKVVSQFTEIVKKAFKDFINDEINLRLKAVMNKTTTEQTDIVNEDVIEEPKSKIITTEEELEAFMITKSILREKVNPDRISYKDATNYFALQLDDNSRKQFCRYYFNTKNKYIVILDSPDRKEEKIQINSLNDIYAYADRIINAVLLLDSQSE